MSRVASTKVGRAGFVEDAANAFDLVGGQVDIATLQRRCEAMPEIGEKGWSIHGAVDHPRRVDTVDPEGGDEGQGFPMPVWDGADQAFADRAPTVKSRELCGETSSPALSDRWRSQAHHPETPADPGRSKAGHAARPHAAF